jgi:hypothetical protein
MDQSKLAYFGGEKTVKKEFPWPVYSDKEKKLLIKALENGEWGKISNPENVSYFDVQCPEYEKACHEEGMWISQNALLGNKKDMESFVLAIKKIQNGKVNF